MKYGHRPYRTTVAEREYAKRYWASLPSEERERKLAQMRKWKQQNRISCLRHSRGTMARLKVAGVWKCSAGLTKEEWRMLKMFYRLARRDDAQDRNP